MYRMLIFAAATALSAGAAVYAEPPAATTTTKTTDPRDQIICRRFVRTGSLADTYRTCKTRREWDQEQANIRAQGASSNSCRDVANGGQC